ncbi:MAG TPA: ribosome biogenesis GTP-binding protein YihA/YsxC [Oscillospiraceae bacterium]|nr:ribosome biogenesis GTP-binding protein YihA/YsxC [Oscillospiraceae bacterium]
MKVTSSEIVISAVSPKQYPDDGKPEFALVGRSNVGKSSVINTMLNRRKLARISSSPGKTRTINFYIINKEFYLVDLPGYGYARVSKGEKANWGNMIETYLKNRKNLYGVILLVDIRHEPTADDKMMYDWIKYYGYDAVVIATKSDKISRGNYQKHLKTIRGKLGMPSTDKIIPVSSLKKEGMDKLWTSLKELFIVNNLPITIEPASR